MFNRGLGKDNFKRFKTDFQFLFERIREERGELELLLRGKYFNLYYRGNSLAKVTFLRENYRVEVHAKFAKGVFERGCFGEPPDGAKYQVYTLSKDRLHPFFSKTHIQKLESQIKGRKPSEEITFEQKLINENRDREDLLLIDRQIAVEGIKGKMDLLALRQKAPNSKQFQFVVLEVKLGNNSELCEKVHGQLTGYVRMIENNFNLFKKCYELVYAQLREVGLITQPAFSSIEIVGPVFKRVIVSDYYGRAEKAMEKWSHEQRSRLLWMHHRIEIEGEGEKGCQ